MKDRVRRLGRVLPGLGGALPTILDRAPVDAAEMSARGMATVIPAASAWLAGTVAFRYAYMLPMLAASTAGLALGIIVLLLDLSLMRAASGRSLPAQIVTYVSRCIFSVLFAVTFAQPIVLFMFAQDVGVQMRADQQVELAAYNRNDIVPRYAPAISADTAEITADQKQLQDASAAVASAALEVQNARLQLTCEAGGVSGTAGCQAGSGLVGQGQVYQVRLTQLENAEADLSAAQGRAQQEQTQIGSQVASLRSAIKSLQVSERDDYAAARARYLRDSGLIARWRALGMLERADPAIRTDVDLLALLIIVVDLTAVLSKISSSTPSYDRVLTAERKKILLSSAVSEEDAHTEADLKRAEREAWTHLHQTRLDVQVDVETERLDAWAQVQKWRIREQARDEMGGEDLSDAPRQRGWQQAQSHGERTNQPANAVPGVSLSHFIRGSRRHEGMAAPMAPALARAAWIGLGLTAALAIVLLLLRPAHELTVGACVVAAALAAGACLAIYSRGFRRGPSWAHRAAFGTALLGLALPALIFVPGI